MSTRRASHSSFLPALLLGLSALLAGCTSPTHRLRPDDGDYASSRAAGEIPGWAHQELSWSKLREIERWYGAEGLRASNHWRTEAQLVAAEGRLVLAQREPGNALAMRQRMAASRHSFEEIRTSARASEMQRNRAKQGLDRIGGFASPREAASSRITSLGPLVARSAWSAKPPVPKRMTPSNHRYTRITVHHSADYVSTQLNGSAASSAKAIKKIQHAHMEGAKTGWGDIGYHFLIDPQGRVFEGRQLGWQGAHASGKNNVGNIGICLLGNFEKKRPTEAALGALERLVASCRNSFGIAPRELHGHDEYKNTQCPGRHLTAWIHSHR